MIANITQIAEQTGNFTWNNSIQVVNDTINIYENVIQSSNQYTYILYGAIVAVTIGGIVYMKYRDKKNEIYQRREKTLLEIRTLVDKIIDLDSKKVMGKEIYIDDLPEDIKEDLKDKTHFLNKVFNDSENTGEPYLFIIKENAEVEIKKKAKPGELVITTKDSTNNDVKKRIELAPSKILSIKWGNKRIKCWIIYENEAEPYPHEPEHHASTFYHIVDKILLTENGLGQKPGKFPKWLILVGVALLLGAIVYFAFFKGDTPTAYEPTIQVINQTINQTATNITKVTATGGTKVINIG